MAVRKFCFAALLVISALAEPASAADNWPASLTAYISELRRTIGTIDMDGLAAIVQNHDRGRLVDVREASEFNAGHIPGSVNAPRSRLEQQIWKVLGYPNKASKSEKIYLLCQRGTRATFAAKDLKDIGFTEVTIVVMTLGEWQKSGHPFVKGDSRENALTAARLIRSDDSVLVMHMISDAVMWVSTAAAATAATALALIFTLNLLADA